MLIYCNQEHNNWIEQIYTPYFKNSPHNSKHLFDIFSLSHIFTFLMLGTIFKNLFGYNKLVIALLALSGIFFEIFENSKDKITMYNSIESKSSGKSSYNGDSLLNITGDITSNTFGLFLAYYCSNKTNLIILLILFMIITYTLGFSYWLDAVKFLSA